MLYVMKESFFCVSLQHYSMVLAMFHNAERPLINWFMKKSIVFLSVVLIVQLVFWLYILINTTGMPEASL